MLNLTRYDNIMILGPDWMENTEEADARTVLCLHILLEAFKTDCDDTVQQMLEDKNEHQE